MKIVHCLFSLNVGGAEVLVVNMLNELCADHQVSLVVVNDRLSEILLDRLDARVAVFRIGRREGSRNLWPVWRFNRVLARMNPDIVHCHDDDLIRLLLRTKARTVYTVHDIGQPVNSKYDAPVAISQAVADDVFRRYDRQIPIVQNGIRWADFQQRTTYKLSANEPFRIIQISRLMPEKKGQDVLIRAIAQVRQHYPFTSIQLDFVGSGAGLAELTQLAELLGVAGQVRFLGDQSPAWVGEHVATYHALAQPSRYEGFGLTVVEGLAAGLPVVAANIDGPADILRGLPAGHLFRSGDSVDLSAALQKLVIQYEAGRIEPALTETRRLLGNNYSIAATVQGYLDIYTQLTAQPSAQLRFANEAHV